jgi:hypothetical protein
VIDITQIDNRIKRFEAALDSELAALEIFRHDASQAIVDAAGSISLIYSEGSSLQKWKGMLADLERGFDVALQTLINKSDGPRLAVDGVIRDLLFLSHYFMLRECLYYSYNSPSSILWTFDQEAIRVEITDTSIPRQFAQYANSLLLNRASLYLRHPDIGDEAIALLRGKEEIGEQRYVTEALMLTEREASLRLSSQFDILGGETSAVQLDGYSYAEFFRVYKYLLAKSLYHQYWARANDTWATFMFSKELLPYEISTNAAVDPPTVEKILRDLSYSKSNGKLPPMYFTMVDHSSLSDYVLVPGALVGSDGPASILRVQAARSPDYFLRNVSVPLGRRFTEMVATPFRAAGFCFAQATRRYIA